MGDTSGALYIVEISNAVSCVRQPGEWASPVHENPSVCDNCSISWGTEADSLTYPDAGWETNLPKDVDFLVGANNSICCPDPMSLAKACGKTGDSPCRNYQLFEYLRLNPGDVDIEFYKAMWRSQPVGKYSNCSIFFAELSEDSIKSFHCFGPAYPQTYGHAKYDRQVPGQTNSFYEIDLSKATPKDVAYRAMRTAGEYLGEADFALSGALKATGIDYQYEPQRLLLEEANREFWMGRNNQLSALLAEDTEALMYYTKAMTHLTRSMAISKQALNGVVGYTYLATFCTK